MRVPGVLTAFLWLAIVGSAPAKAEDTRAHRPGNIAEMGLSNPPSGYVHFCKRLPELCHPLKGSPVDLTLTKDDWSTLRDVNRRVNRRITAVTDRDNYGMNEFWTFPNAAKAGDCEDFVLLKRRVLTDLGFPENALLITVVLDEKGEGHAVLTVATTAGDYILDNRRNDIRPWTQANYRFLKRQSFRDPSRWVSLVEDGQQQPASASTRSSAAQ